MQMNYSGVCKLEILDLKSVAKLAFSLDYESLVNKKLTK